MPRYDHVLIIMEENKSPAEIIGSPYAPNLTDLARRYGLASRYYGVVHPSEGNYVALIAGDSFGIHDDDAYFCTPHSSDEACKHADRPGYVDHTIEAPSIADQLTRRRLDWRVYAESIPSPGAADVVFPRRGSTLGQPAALYASKHDGFMNIASVLRDPSRGRHIVGFDTLPADLDRDRFPAFALIVPNQCDDMHGLEGAHVPPDCAKSNEPGRIARGDAVAGRLVGEIIGSRVWSQSGNAAIIIVFDEGGHHPAPGDPQGCCGAAPDNPANTGGGHALAIVITNHGPRGVVDPTPYNHYSLLRTIENVLRLGNNLGHAGDRETIDMKPLFALTR